MKTRTLSFLAIQAALAATLLQALPSRADDTPPTGAPTTGTDVPWYISPGVGILLKTIFHR